MEGTIGREVTGSPGMVTSSSFWATDSRFCHNCVTSGQESECRKEGRASLLHGTTFRFSACSCRNGWIFSTPSSMAAWPTTAQRWYTHSVLWTAIAIATRRDTPARPKR